MCVTTRASLLQYNVWVYQSTLLKWNIGLELNVKCTHLGRTLSSKLWNICFIHAVKGVMSNLENNVCLSLGVSSLTLWEPGYDIFVLALRPKTSSCQLPYHRPSSSADYARELFNGSNGSASLVDYTRKKIFGWGVRIFCEWRHKWSSFRVILTHVARPKAQLLGQSVSLKFSLEIRLESESFEPLITF